MAMFSKKNLAFHKKPTEIIKLDLNENPLGASPLAIAAGQKALLNCHRYPDSHGNTLKKSLSTHLNIAPENITLGNGSESLLELIVHTTLNPLNSAVIPRFCFAGISKVLKKAHIKIKHAKNELFSISAQCLLDAIDPWTKIIFIVNPNNPTGSYMNKFELHYLFENISKDILVVLDEAYNEYVEIADYPNSISLLSQYSNLIILRTFSKFYGLAGLRLGYAMSHPKIASILNRNSLPFRINAVALAAAEASLKDKKHIHLSRLLNRQEHAKLSKGLQNLGLTILPSHANFLCIDLKSPSWPIHQQLLLAGISVRPLLDYGLPHFLRISIGMPQQNQYFLTILKKILIQTDSNKSC
ncbi:histidinol-phosphate aminotransferase [Rickettsiella grylli]|uniref:histidinol-phosphate transaminase n=2 Tax=Rickettsiella grylli TaxID=59196 RepID=A8PKD2_9COXI|nr:histidinol-phosphate aminotransferase [Rickettsiella grylli]